jgi:polyhydroxybutyrate depolymerase
MAISRIKNFLLFAALALSIAGVAGTSRAADQPKGLAAAAGDHDESMKSGDFTRNFEVHLPPRYDGKAKLPVVIMLHGSGGEGKEAGKDTGWSAKADRENFIAVFPDGLPTKPLMPASFIFNPRIWNDGSKRGTGGRENVDDVAFLDQMIDYLEAHYAVDPRRIYMTGFSNGASMTWYAGERMSDRLAAIAPVSGHLWTRGGTLKYPLPALFIVGAADPLNPLSGGDVRLWGKTQHRPPPGDSPQEWARMLNCAPQVVTAPSPGGVHEAIYDHCAQGSEVIFYTIDGMGHVWPGGINRLPERFVGKPTDKLNATDVIWQFFRAHPRSSIAISAAGQ